MCEFQVLSENRDSSSRWLRTVPGRKPTTTFCWSKTRGMDTLCTVEKTQMILAKQFLISLSASTSSEIGNPIPCSKQLQPLKKILTETKQFQPSDIIWRSSLIYNYSPESFNQNRKFKKTGLFSSHFEYCSLFMCNVCIYLLIFGLCMCSL